jgi:anti-sigma-K factor RskA
VNDRLNDRPDPEEQAILDALAALEDGEPAAGGRETRAYTELLGLLPHGLEPVVPSPEVRRRVLAAVGERGRPSAAAPRSAARWPLALAAAIAAVAIGLAGWLGARVGAQDATIEALTAELAAAAERSSRLARENAELTAARGALAHQLSLATSPGMVACPLEPMDEDHPGVRGMLFLSPGGGPWLLSVQDLEPPPAGGVYVVWFLGGDDPHHMGVLAPGPDRTVQLTAERMPGHESMTGVAVTLEPSAAVERPTGPTLLFGDRQIGLS